MKFLTIPAGILVFLAMLFWTLPPDKALYWAGPNLQPKLQLVAVTGSTGRGGAAYASIDQLRIDQPHWRWKLSSLLKGRLGFDIEGLIAGQPIRLVVEAGLPSKIHIHDLKADLPVQSLLPLLKLPLPVGGNLRADIDYLRISNNQPDFAEGSILLNKAAWRLMRPPLPLGSALLELSTEDKQIKAVLSQQPGSPVELQGQATLSQDGQYDFDARLKPLPSADPRLSSLMQGLGKKDNRGWYKVETKGSL